MTDMIQHANQPQDEYTAKKKKRICKPRTVKRFAPRPKITQPDDSSIRYISLTRGQIAVVDAHLYEWLMEWNWHAGIGDEKDSFYAQRCAYSKDGKTSHIKMHNQIVGKRDDDSRIVDHKNRNSLINLGSNLRYATKSENQRNRKLSSNSTSGYFGVTFDKSRNKWASVIEVHGKKYRLGRFDTAEHAARVRDAKAIELHGEFAVLNFPID